MTETVWINAPDGGIGVPFYYGNVQFYTIGSSEYHTNEMQFDKVTLDILNILDERVIR